MTEVERQAVRLRELKVQRQELERQIAEAEGERKNELRLALAICLEDILSAASLLRGVKDSDARLAPASTPVWQGEDNSEEISRLKRAADKIEPHTAKQSEYLSLYRQGMSVSEIARMYGVSPSAASRTLTRAKITERKAADAYLEVRKRLDAGELCPAEGVAVTAHQRELIAKWRDGASQKELAAEYGVSQSCISKTLMRARKTEARLLALAADVGEDAADEAVLDLSDPSVLYMATGILTTWQQEIIYLRLCERLNCDAIADMLGIKAGAVDTVVKLGLARLAVRLGAKSLRLVAADAVPAMLDSAYDRLGEVSDGEPPSEGAVKRVSQRTEAHRAEELSVSIEYADGRSTDMAHIDDCTTRRMSPFLRRLLKAKKGKDLKSRLQQFFKRLKKRT